MMTSVYGLFIHHDTAFDSVASHSPSLFLSLPPFLSHPLSPSHYLPLCLSPISLCLLSPSVSPADSDVELIDISSGNGTHQGNSHRSTSRSLSRGNSHQPIVHFEASVSVRARSPSYDYDMNLLPTELETPKM